MQKSDFTEATALYALFKGAGRGILLLAALLAALLLSAGEARAQDCPESEEERRLRALINIQGQVRGSLELCGGEVTVGEGGSIEPNEGDEAISSGRPVDLTVRVLANVENVIEAIRERVRGPVQGVETVRVEVVDEEGETTDTVTIEVEADPDGALDLSTLDLSELSFCARWRDRRCELYEALPSVLAGMNGMLSHEERMSAPRSARGVWARVEGASGDWKADASETGVEYEYNRYGVRVGVDVGLGANALLGFSARHARGSADVDGAGEIEVSGSGLGVSAAWAFGEGFYLEGQVEATSYEADLDSDARGELETGASGSGWAAGVELGRRVESGGLTFTPSVRLVHSSVSLDDFTDAVGSRVSVEDGEIFTGAAGVSVERRTGAGRLFGAAGFARDFSAGTSVRVSGERLKAKAEASRVRLRGGGVHAWGEEGKYEIRGSVDFSAAGEDREVGGSVSLRARF